MVVSLVDDLTSTFTTTPDPEELLSKTITIIVLFGVLWGGGALLLTAFYSRVIVEKQKVNKLVVAGQLSPAKPAAGAGEVELQRANLLYMREYVHLLLPAIYDSSKTLSMRIYNELLSCHKYMVLMAPVATDDDKAHRVRMTFQLLTTQTIFLFLIAWIYDLDVSSTVMISQAVVLFCFTFVLFVWVSIEPR